jgi:anti-sigma factor RsiW
MRCSWCESRLDEYVDATLSPVQMRAMYVHLQSCPDCEALHRRVRVVDGLLHTTRAIQLDGDFTSLVMTQIEVLPTPRVPRQSLWLFGAFYLVCAWALVAAAMLALRPGTFAAAGLAFNGVGALRALMQGAHALWPIAPLAVFLVAGALSVDALLLTAIVLFYRTLRPRLAAALAARAEVQS